MIKLAKYFMYYMISQVYSKVGNYFIFLCILLELHNLCMDV